MPLVETPNAELGVTAPPFALKGTDGTTYTLDDVRGEKATLVMFICNHCPYVKAVIERLVETVEALREEGVGAVAVMPNDTSNYPQDSFGNMIAFAKAHRFGFPYVIDETQDVARAYGAVCTPDFFGYDADLKLKYRGRLDEGRTDPPSPGAKRELHDAMVMIAHAGEGPEVQLPSMGCSVKWKL